MLGNGGLLSLGLQQSLISGANTNQSLYHAFLQNLKLSSLWHSEEPAFFGDTNIILTKSDALGKTKDGIPYDPPAPPSPAKFTLSVQPQQSGDPNEKTTSGVGEQGYVDGSQAIQYTIHFENAVSAGATAPLQELLVTDQLSSDLDWSYLPIHRPALRREGRPSGRREDDPRYGHERPHRPEPRPDRCGL